MSFTNILAVYNLANAADALEGTAWYKRANELASHLACRYGVTSYAVSYTHLTLPTKRIV